MDAGLTEPSRGNPERSGGGPISVSNQTEDVLAAHTVLFMYEEKSGKRVAEKV